MKPTQKKLINYLILQKHYKNIKKNKNFKFINLFFFNKIVKY